MRATAVLALAASLCNAIGLSAAEPAWQSLIGDVDPARDAVAGAWVRAGDVVTVSAADGARLMLPVAPQGEYDVRVSFTRNSGQHSIGVFFTHGGKQAAFEVDAWGMHLAGIQNISGRTIRDNPTRQENYALTNGQRYTLLVEVRKDGVRGLLDGKVIAAHKTDGSDLSVPELWSLPRSDRLAIGAWASDTTFHRIEVRSVSGTPIAVARTTPSSSVPKSAPSPAPTPKTAPAPAANRGTAKRVLIVIANHHFFYREYAEPREELERAGIEVTVAAGRKAPCRPHGGSGQGNSDGVVQPDLAIADVKAADYDAILFSGGWGASMYQFAFTGRYNDPAYNGDPGTKSAVNRVINDFIAQDKYVCALCNGVSVLAWARVNGRSPLAGKRVCAPTRDAAAGIYNGRPAQPSCRWHPEVNGAILSPAGSIGQPGTPVDDVLVDGKIITGEDDPSAREMGRRIAEVLTQR